ncbi:hypothetical protein ACKC6R_18150 [Klebsiella pneumoniae]|uniref:hypothetical protein n=1 Tax=Klebsiella pneumoniae TaxID=573 RepID=UPI0038B42F1F
MLIGSCAIDLPAPVVVDTACSWVRLIYLTDHDINVMDKQTKRSILLNNKLIVQTCKVKNIPLHSSANQYKNQSHD